MLIEFSVKNFRSINERQVLNFVAKSSKEFQDENTFIAGGVSKLRLINSIAIYGPNASGKTNILKAFSTMRNIVVNFSSNQQRGDGLPVDPFLLNEESKISPSEFYAEFIVNDVRYQYGFSLTRKRIHEEWLYAFPKGRVQEWFHREWNNSAEDYDWYLGPKLLGEKSVWVKSTRENALFLSTAVQLNNAQFQPVFDWFKNNCKIANIDGWGENFSVRMCKKDRKKDILKFLKTADLGISDIKITDLPIPSIGFPDGMPEEIKQDIINSIKKDGGMVDIDFVHETPSGQKMTLSLLEESLGTSRLFAFAGPWIDCLENGYIFFIDELHQHLHPKLVSFLVSLFHNKETNPNNAQLVFTTHETSILNEGVLRRDQIVFCEKNEELSSQYSYLSEFKVQKGRNIELGYLSGRYGAIPFLKNYLDVKKN